MLNKNLKQYQFQFSHFYQQVYFFNSFHASTSANKAPSGFHTASSNSTAQHTSSPSEHQGSHAPQHDARTSSQFGERPFHASSSPPGAATEKQLQQFPAEDGLQGAF